MIRDPAPVDTDLTSLQRGGFYLKFRREYWNDGIMEYWKSIADDGLILQTDSNHLYKNRSHPTKPSIPKFQYSIIPLPLAAGFMA